MTIQLYNTLTKKVEDFKHKKGSPVLMYNCGPTVYDFAHIGNLNAYIFADILRRTLEYVGFEVKQVMNITDFGHLTSDGDNGDDKMTQGLLREGLDLTVENMRVLAEKYAKAFTEDMALVNNESPHIMPFASDNIDADIDLISKLVAKNLVYKTSDGMYFDTSAIKDYGKLGGLSPIDESVPRISGNNEKKSPRDFAVWKFNQNLGWESPWGKGFPGWHIECSGMATKFLGNKIDIHTGGADHIATHHNNEIAQSENATGESPFARFWLHVQFLRVGGEKMSKSKNNFYTLRDIMNKGYSPLAFRYLALSSHYRSSLNFTFESLSAASTAYTRLIERLSSMPEGGSPIANIKKTFIEIISHDLDTPKALAYVHTFVSEPFAPADVRATILDFDNVLGLGLKDSVRKYKEEQSNIPQEIRELAERRKSFRDSKDFLSSDKVRDELIALGYDILDNEDGYSLKKR